MPEVWLPLTANFEQFITIAVVSTMRASTVVARI
jgi:hypothetical protein